jgi:t-SNARE complex subunit (syntaxin)
MDAIEQVDHTMYVLQPVRGFYTSFRRDLSTPPAFNRNQKPMTPTQLKDTQKEAIKFAAGFRGQYIISQALYHAVKVLREVPAPHTEHSNIEDMEFLLTHLFNIYPSLQEQQEDQKQRGLFDADEEGGDE